MAVSEIGLLTEKAERFFGRVRQITGAGDFGRSASQLEATMSLYANNTFLDVIVHQAQVAYLTQQLNSHRKELLCRQECGRRPGAAHPA
jgi:hypothetical protein